MSEHTNDNHPSAPSEAKVFPDADPRYPLCHVQIAMHLGIPVFRADEAAENLRRVKALIKTYREQGVMLLSKGEGQEPFTEDDVTPELIAEHEGQETCGGKHTPASFDDHLLDIISNHTGKPRVSYVHIRKHALRSCAPVDIYQEVGDKEGEERRRVAVYLTGQHLWVTDNYEGTGETEKDDTRFPGLGILNDRYGQTARMIEADEFERLWERATSEECGWGLKFKAEPVVTVLEDAEVISCTRVKEPDSEFCAGHAELARRMFPRLFETA